MSVVAELDYAAPAVVTAPAAIAAYEIHASLTLAGFAGDPAMVTAHLGLEPTRTARRAGGLYRALRIAGPGHDGASEWVFRPPLDLPEPRPARLALAELLRPLRDALEPRRDRLATLPRCTREIRIEIVPQGTTPKIAFEAGDLDFLDRLGLTWAIDIRTAAA
jgi:hypothetical protein